MEHAFCFRASELPVAVTEPDFSHLVPLTFFSNFFGFMQPLSKDTPLPSVSSPTHPDYIDVKFAAL